MGDGKNRDVGCMALALAAVLLLVLVAILGAVVYMAHSMFDFQG